MERTDFVIRRHRRIEETELDHRIGAPPGGVHEGPRERMRDTAPCVALQQSMDPGR